MDNHRIGGGYLHMKIDGRTIKIPLEFIKVITPVYDEYETMRGGGGENPMYTFDIWIYPSFAQSHGIHMRKIELTGELYSTMHPTSDASLAHTMHRDLSEFHGFPDKLLYGKSWQ